MRVIIEKLITGAIGLAHKDGKSLFIPSTLPQEEVECHVVQDKKNYSLCALDEIITPSLDRIKPSCPYSGRCGGCDFDFVDAKTSAELKNEIVQDNLKRIGKLDYEFEVFPPAFSKGEDYRIRVRFHLDLKTRTIGFLPSKGSKLVPITKCLRLTERLNSLLEEKTTLLNYAKKLSLTKGVNQYGYVEVPLLDGEDKVSFGQDEVIIKVENYNYHADSSVFFQSNIEVLPSMLAFVKEETVGTKIMDLYSGVGTFSALFPDKRVYSVEKFKPCLQYAKKNAPTSIAVTEDVLAWAKTVRKEEIDTIIVDPPRVGLAKGVPELLKGFSPKRIIYVSCDSVTLSRDLPCFAPYTVKKCKVFDLYPGSSHEESVVVLEK